MINGFSPLNVYDVQDYLDTLETAKPYDDEEGIEIDLNLERADITSIFLKSMSIPDKDQLGVLIQDIIDLDIAFITRGKTREFFKRYGFEYDCPTIELKNLCEMNMVYSHKHSNDRWGLEYKKNESGKWQETNIFF